jgi:hypothetical protein
MHLIDIWTTRIIYILFVGYIILSQIFALYFWYEWAQDHSFFSALFIGPFVAEIKGLAWPWFI